MLRPPPHILAYTSSSVFASLVDHVRAHGEVQVRGEDRRFECEYVDNKKQGIPGLSTYSHHLLAPFSQAKAHKSLINP